MSLAAGHLQRKKIIGYTHGAVTIVNRKSLEDSACECYGVLQQSTRHEMRLPQSMTIPDAHFGLTITPTILSFIASTTVLA
jgi:hypothetical protein